MSSVSIIAKQHNRRKVDGGHIVTEPSIVELVAIDTSSIPDCVSLTKVATDRFRKVCSIMGKHRDRFKVKHGKAMHMPLKWTKPITLEVRVNDELILDTTTLLFEGMITWTPRCSNADQLSDYLELALDMAGALQIED